MGGVALGSLALVVVLSVANGFEDEVRQRILGADAPLRVSTFHEKGALNWESVMDSILAMEKVEAATPYILDKGMIRHKRTAEGCIVRGIDPETVGEVNDIPGMLIAGTIDSLLASEDEPGRLPGIILGRFLADAAYAAPGDTIFLFSPTGTGPFAQPLVGKFIVHGILESGLAEFDQVFCYIHIEEAQSLFSMTGKISGIDVKTTTLQDADFVKTTIENEIGYPWYPRTWFEMRKTLYTWMRLEKWAFFIILSLIILVAAFNIISTLVMVTMEKRKEIGILAAMGASQKEIGRIFMLQGLTIGIAGTGIGLVSGWILLFIQQEFRLLSLPPDVYMLSTFPVLIKYGDFAAVAVVGVLLCLIAAVYPARRAAALDPLEAIRYE